MLPEGLESERGHPFSRMGRVSRVEKVFCSTESKTVLDRVPQATDEAGVATETSDDESRVVTTKTLLCDDKARVAGESLLF